MTEREPHLGETQTTPEDERKLLLIRYISLNGNQNGQLVEALRSDLESIRPTIEEKSAAGVDDLISSLPCESGSNDKIYRTPYGNIVYDYERRAVISPLKPDEEISLTAAENSIFRELVENQGKVVSYKKLYEGYTDDEAVMDDLYMRKQIKDFVHKLRKKLNQKKDGKEKLIFTSHNKGYIFTPPHTLEERILKAGQATFPKPQETVTEDAQMEQVSRIIRYQSPSGITVVLDTNASLATSSLQTPDSEPVYLTPFESQILERLIRHPSKIFTKEDLAEEKYYIPGVKTHIAHLRKKLLDIRRTTTKKSYRGHYRLIHTRPDGYSLWAGYPSQENRVNQDDTQQLNSRLAPLA